MTRQASPRAVALAWNASVLTHLGPIGPLSTHTGRERPRPANGRPSDTRARTRYPLPLRNPAGTPQGPSRYAVATNPCQALLHYRLIEEIGAGAMGTVWRARDTTLDRDVAIKVLPDAMANDPQYLARFEREAKILASLNHPNLAAVYGVHETDGTRFLAMEFVPGEDLSERVLRGPLPPDELIPIACRITRAVQAAHESAVIHRDLKPANIRLLPDGGVKVLDFGIAKDLQRNPADPSSDPVALTSTGVVLGTAPYMSPEQVRGAAVDARSDIWSFGCVLWECVTGERPFRGETVPDVIGEILHSEPDWAALPAGTPIGIRKVLRRCLAKDPCSRFHHIADTRLELEDAEVPAPVSAEPLATVAPTRRVPVTALLAIPLLAASMFLLIDRKPDDTQAPTAGRSLAITSMIRLTDFPGSEFDPVISPDGRYVVFVADRDGPFHVWGGPIGGGAFHNLSRDNPAAIVDDVRAPVRMLGFLPGGAEIWIRQSQVRGMTMRRMSIMGGEVRPLLEKKAVSADWSPDGTRVVYAHGTGGDPVFVADASGEHRTRILSSEPGFHQHYPTWSPDGEWIYLTRGWETTGETAIWRVRPDGSDLEKLSEGTRRVTHPTPLDEDTLLYVAQEENGSGPWLWVLDLESKVSRRATLGLEKFMSVSASADGRRIVAAVANPTAGLYSFPILERAATEADVEPYALGNVRALAPRIRGEDLFYLSSLGAGDGLWRQRAGKVSEIWRGSEFPLLEPAAISADGTHIAVVRRKGRRVSLCVVAANGTEPRTLAESLDVRGSACWSPQGEVARRRWNRERAKGPVQGLDARRSPGTPGQGRRAQPRLVPRRHDDRVRGQSGERIHALAGGQSERRADRAPQDPGEGLRGTHAVHAGRRRPRLHEAHRQRAGLLPARLGEPD